jgi:hypothetical protein
MNNLCERKLLPISTNFEVINEIDPNYDANYLVINEDDIVIVNEPDYTI